MLVEVDDDLIDGVLGESAVTREELGVRGPELEEAPLRAPPAVEPGQLVQEPRRRRRSSSSIPSSFSFR
jgi:hypothetical protein